MRIFTSALSIAVTVMLALPYAAPGDTLTIIADPGPFASIEKAAVSEKSVDWWDADISDDRACTESFAAYELASLLPECTSLSGSDIKLSGTDDIPVSGDVIILASGDSPLVKQYPMPDSLSLETGQSYRIQAFRDNGRTVTVIEGGKRIGTLYGAYGYLELLGVRFYGLGETGTVYPDEPRLMPTDTMVLVNPSFLTRGFHAWEDRSTPDFLLWMVRNHMNFWTAADSDVHTCKKFGMKLADGGHTIQKDFLNPDMPYPYNHPRFKGDESNPPDPYDPGNEYSGDVNGDGTLTYFEAHPEWYGLYDGKRSDNVRTEFGNNYCTSNLDATRELARNLIQSLVDGKYRYVDFINFWMMDATYKWCECEKCAQQGTPTDRLLAVIAVVQEELRKAHESGTLTHDVELSSLVYLDTITPPTRPLPDGFDYDSFSMVFFPIQRCYNHTFADPACTELNAAQVGNYLAWTQGEGGHYRGTMFIGEYYNVSYLKSMPMLYTRTMAADIPWYYRTGTRHFHYMHTPTALWGTWTLNQYLLGRLLWDVGTDSDALLDEYFHRRYPTAHIQARRFYENLERGMESFKALRYWGWKNSFGKPDTPLFPKKHVQYEHTEYLTNDGTDLTDMRQYMSVAHKALEAALVQCRDHSEEMRLREDEQRFTYGELMVAFHYHLYRTEMYDRAGNTEMARQEYGFLALAAERLREIVDLVQVSSSHANAENGLDATMAADLYERFGEKYGQ